MTHQINCFAKLLSSVCIKFYFANTSATWLSGVKTISFTQQIDLATCGVTLNQVLTTYPAQFVPFQVDVVTRYATSNKEWASDIICSILCIE